LELAADVRNFTFRTERIDALALLFCELLLKLLQPSAQRVDPAARLKAHNPPTGHAEHIGWEPGTSDAFGLRLRLWLGGTFVGWHGLVLRLLRHLSGTLLRPLLLECHEARRLLQLLLDARHLTLRTLRQLLTLRGFLAAHHFCLRHVWRHVWVAAVHVRLHGLQGHILELF
jgi:hypothetical protein